MKPEELEIANEVIKQVNLYFDTDCQVKTRKRSVSHPRMMACYIISKLIPKATLDAIGKLFDVTHATVIHAINSTEDSIKYYQRDMEDYLSIRTAVEESKPSTTVAFKEGVREEFAISLYKLILSKPIEEIHELLTQTK